MVNWLYTLPLWLLAVLFVGLWSGLAVIGLFLTRKLIYRKFIVNDASNLPVGYFISALYVFYGLLLSLIAVAAWQDYQDAAKQTLIESAALGSLYRDVSAYPEEVRNLLLEDLREYANWILVVEWPAQRRGETLPEGDFLLSSFQRHLLDAAEKGEVRDEIFAKSLSSFSTLVEERRIRTGEHNNGLPAPLWYVVIAGGVLSLTITYFLYFEDFKVHLVMTIFIAAFTGLAVFVTFAMDHPYRGDFSVPDSAYRVSLDSLFQDTP